MNEKKLLSELTIEEAKVLLRTIIEEPDKDVNDACRKATEWHAARGGVLTIENIIDSVEVAQMTLAEDFKGWDEMKNDEKNDLAEMMCGLMVARDMLADMLGLPMKGQLVEEDE